MAYRCSKCNASLNFDISNNNLKCDYCKTNYSIPKNHIIDNYLIPFKISKIEAINKYKRLIKSRIITPKVFKSINTVNKFEGIYVPVQLCDVFISGTAEYKGIKLNSWKSDGKTYEKSDIYRIVKKGSLSLNNIPISCFKQIKDEIIDNIGKYDYSKKVLYDKALMNDYKICKTDKDNDSIYESIKQRSKKLFLNEFRKDIKNYDEVVDFDSVVACKLKHITYILLPIWLLNITYKNKKYVFAINGQTGKMYGNIPTSKRKLIRFSFILFILIFILLLILNILKVVYL